MIYLRAMNISHNRIQTAIAKMQTRNKIIVGLSILVVIVIMVTLFVFKDKLTSGDTSRTEATRLSDPRLVTLDFYNQWLSDLKSTTTTPFESGLINSPVLSEEVRDQIDRNQANRKKTGVDPVLCLPKIPNRIISKQISSTDNKALVVITPRDKDIKTEHQAIVSLTLINNAWVITKLDCSVGETPLAKEFDFEKSGFLLKQSVQAPYNKENWHLVYEQETEPGFVVPLTFNTESLCITADGTLSMCDQTKLTEATEVFVQAAMTETGAVVKRMTFKQ